MHDFKIGKVFTRLMTKVGLAQHNLQSRRHTYAANSNESSITMMVNLPPFSIYSPKDLARPDSHVQNHFAGSVLPSLSAHDIKDVAGFMVAVVIKFEPVFT